MTFSDIRLIATDMDGTLLNSQHELSPDFYPVFESLKARQIVFVAASGRQYFNLEKTLDAIKNDVVFAAENGSYVVFQGKELHTQAMDQEVVKDFVAITREIPECYAVICGKKKAYVENDEPGFIDRLKLYFERYEIVPDLTAIEDDEFLKYTVCDLKGSEGNSYPHFKSYEKDFQVKVSGPIWLDISHKDANKGRAMEVIQEKFGISPDETMAFGDYLNDLEMLQKARYSFAMANAHPEIRKIARYHAGSNDENGVVEVLKQLK
ncbi:HAD family hydrolase [Dyadobacter sandarakinus]|uniref:HAD family phosphatase n=1 Tax=Dyadobacter sandarakinus TaxID=2747268 RepID=A0ABX7IC16_9BACT|nr:HAD family hydrolase [Dyadobacter sandarakinus]QRR03654.1 HAD family phosphatase [Dyadobacter sandarakinus]